MMYILILIVLVVSIFIQNNIDKNMKDNKIYLNNLDILRYICSILIIILHIRPFYLYNNLDFIFNNYITKIGVPIFFTITGYFLFKKEKDNQLYIKKYLKNILVIYLIWSVIYLPFFIKYSTDYVGFDNGYLFIFDKSKILYSILVGLLYNGLFYHLWYFPALILSIIILYILKKKINIKVILFISFILLVIGSFESYCGLLPLSIRSILTNYLKIFYTTRNGLFFGLFYLTLGYYLGSKDILQIESNFILLLFFIFLLALESNFISYIYYTRLDILLTVPFIVYFMFTSFIYITNNKNTLKIRQLSKYYYLIHPLIIVFYRLITKGKFDNPIIIIPVIIIGTHIISCLIIKIKTMLKLA